MTNILATRLATRWPHPPPLEIHVDGKLQVEGNLYAFTNPAIESAFKRAVKKYPNAFRRLTD